MENSINYREKSEAMDPITKREIKRLIEEYEYEINQLSGDLFLVKHKVTQDAIKRRMSDNMFAICDLKKIK